MAQKIIGNQLNRETRNAINDNDTELFKAVNNISGKITDEIYDEIRNDVKLNWKEPVNTVADLPTNGKAGETRMVRETVNGVSPVYRYNGIEWVEIQQIDSTAITEVDQRLQAEINKRETPEGAQEKANKAEANALKAVNRLETKIYSDVDEVVKVVESGSNSNGYYMRWSDGKQECWGMKVSQAPNVDSGNIFRSEVARVDFPKPFNLSYPIFVSAQVASIARWANPSIIRSSNVDVFQYGTNKSDSAFTTSLYAVGRWK